MRKKLVENSEYVTYKLPASLDNEEVSAEFKRWFGILEESLFSKIKARIIKETDLNPEALAFLLAVFF